MVKTAASSFAFASIASIEFHLEADRFYLDFLEFFVSLSSRKFPMQTARVREIEVCKVKYKMS